MRTFVVVGLAAVIVLLLPSPASAQGVEVFSRQKVEGGIGEPGDWQLFRFEAYSGDLLTLKLKVPRKSGLRPLVQLVGENGEIAIPAVENGRLSIRKLPIQGVGTHYFAVYGAGTTGGYKLSLKLKRAKILPVQTAVPGPVVFHAVRGAVVTAKVKAAKGSDLEPGIASLGDVYGTDHLDPTRVKEKGKKAKLEKHPIAVSGAQTLDLVARAGAGDAVVKLKVKDPRPPDRKLNRMNAAETLLLVWRMPDDSGGWDHGLTAEVMGDGVTGVTLKFPAGSGIPDAVLASDPGEPGEFGYETVGQPPNGVYTLVITRDDGAVREVPVAVRGGYPSEVVPAIADESTARPTVSWTGGAGAQMIYLNVEEAATPSQDEDDYDDGYQFLVDPAGSPHRVPDGPLDAGTFKRVEMWALSQFHKVTVAVLWP